MKTVGTVVMTIVVVLLVVWLFYQAKQAVDCESRGGAYVKTFGGYACIGGR